MVTLKKSQISIEFTLISGLVMITAIIFISIALDQAKTLYETKESLLIKDVASKIQSEISIASYVEDGYSRQFEIPEKINNRDYNISIRSNILIVWTNTTTHIAEILNTTGQLEKGSNTITKISGKIYLN